jgi:hypothetical protein
MESKELAAQEQQEALERLVALAGRQTRLLEEIRDLLAAEKTPRRVTSATRPADGAE